MMLSELCKELNNWFDYSRKFGTFTISDGQLQVDFLQENQYYRIVGSVFNDGVYQYTTAPNSGVSPLPLYNETFEGAVWLMAVPPDVLTLAGEIETWIGKYNEASTSPYQSESFGGYSYTKASSGDGGNGATWQSQFRSRLNQWRKL